MDDEKPEHASAETMKVKLPQPPMLEDVMLLKFDVWCGMQLLLSGPSTELTSSAPS